MKEKPNLSKKDYITLREPGKNRQTLQPQDAGRYNIGRVSIDIRFPQMRPDRHPHAVISTGEVSVGMLLADGRGQVSLDTGETIVVSTPKLNARLEEKIHYDPTLRGELLYRRGW